jgi:hypothetical protein
MHGVYDSEFPAAERKTRYHFSLACERRKKASRDDKDHSFHYHTQQRATMILFLSSFYF